jgi:hypothetical protein
MGQLSEKLQLDNAEIISPNCFHAGFFHGLFFNPENGGDMLF